MQVICNFHCRLFQLISRNNIQDSTKDFFQYILLIQSRFKFSSVFFYPPWQNFNWFLVQTIWNLEQQEKSNSAIPPITKRNSSNLKIFHEFAKSIQIEPHSVNKSNVKNYFWLVVNQVKISEEKIKILTDQ